MSEENPSTRAVTKAPQNKNKVSSNYKNKYLDMEMKTGVSVQAVSESFAEDLFLGEQDAGQTASSTQDTRCKKRNKSVRFVLEGECTSKKYKDEDRNVKSLHDVHSFQIIHSRTFHNSHMMKYKKSGYKDREVKLNDEMEASTSTASVVVPKKMRLTVCAIAKQKKMDTACEQNKDILDTECNNPPLKHKKPKRSKTCSSSARKDASNVAAIKIHNKKTSDDELTSDLENLHIGPKENHLTSLLDNTVPAWSMNCDSKLPELAAQTDMNSNFSHEFDLKKVVKWTKRRWDKDSKEASVINMQCSAVVVKNLPLKTSLYLYQEKLAEIFESIGCIKRIGPPVMCPVEDGDAMFSTTIYFDTEEAATRALEKDNVLFYGTAIRVSRPLPPTETTVVARSCTQLPIDEVRAIFEGAGPLRCVRGGKRRGSGRMTVAFLEFDGPEAVQRALTLSGNAKINGELVYVNKFEVRYNKNRQPEKDDSASPLSTV